MFEGEEGFKLVLYIKVLFERGEKLAKEDHLKPEGDFLVVCDTFVELSLFFLEQHQARVQYEDSFLGPFFYGLCHV